MLESGAVMPEGPSMLLIAPLLLIGRLFTRITVLTAFAFRASFTVEGCLESI